MSLVDRSQLTAGGRNRQVKDVVCGKRKKKVDANDKVCVEVIIEQFMVQGEFKGGSLMDSFGRYSVTTTGLD